MCDEDSFKESGSEEGNAFNRRQFTRLAASGTFIAMMPSLSTANAKTLSESEVTIKTPDGEADAYFVHPTEGKHPAILVWPDILGLRPAFSAMGKRLAEAGYAVLVINPYYRTAKAPVVPEGASFRDESIRARVRPMADQLNAQTHVTDARAFVSFIDQQPAVDTQRKIGTIGYCMGGPIVMRTAAAIPERIGAVGSFHGGGLATDKEDSPHLLIPTMKAGFLIAIAQNDHEKDTNVKGILIDSFKQAKLPAEVEVYEGAMHGWCVLDSPAYDHDQAEKAWGRMLALFERSL